MYSWARTRRPSLSQADRRASSGQEPSPVKAHQFERPAPRILMALDARRIDDAVDIQVGLNLSPGQMDMGAVAVYTLDGRIARLDAEILLGEIGLIIGPPELSAGRPRPQGIGKLVVKVVVEAHNKERILMAFGTGRREQEGDHQIRPLDGWIRPSTEPDESVSSPGRP